MPILEIRLKIRVLVEEDEGTYMAYCPDLPGLAVEADEFADLKKHVHCAVNGYIESLLKHGDPIPVGVMESEAEHSVFGFLAEKIRQRFSRHPVKQYIEEITLPSNHLTVCIGATP